jgi:hypothetical protein
MMTSDYDDVEGYDGVGAVEIVGAASDDAQCSI